MTYRLLSIVVACVVSAGSFAGEPRPVLQIGALHMAPADRPGDQLVRLRLEGTSSPGPWTATIDVPGKDSVSASCGARVEGRESFTVAVPGVDEECDVRIALRAGEETASATVRLRPLRSWRIFIVQHTHTDMGYTDYPSRLTADHLDFIEEAIRACDHTDGHPDDAKFRWTCEATWATERLLDQRSDDLLKRFLARVAQGRIEVTGMNMNMTDLATEEMVARSFYPVARLRGLGVPVRNAMQCDVNGYPWALPEMLANLGITGLVGGINVTRSTLPFAFPRAIRWESPSGGTVLAWRGEHYMMANFLGFQESIEKVISKLPPYLASLQERGYPYDAVLLQMAGYYTDNAAPSFKVCDLVREWNDRFATPKVRVAVLNDFMEALGTSPDAPRTRKAWPDWWADGVGSAALETAVVREAQERLSLAETFLGLARVALPGQRDWRDVAREAHLRARLYDEHTFGAAESIDRPSTINTKVEWGEKSMNAYRANLLSTELESGALTAWAPRLVADGEYGIVVFNALGWSRTAPVVARLSRGIVDEDRPFRLVDPTTRSEVPYQLGVGARNWREVEFVATDVPSVGYKTYRVEVGQEPASWDEACRVEGVELSNGLTTVRLDPEKTAIASIVPAGASENVVGAAEEHAFNQCVYEGIVHEKGRWYLWPAPAPYDPAAFERKVPGAAEVSVGSKGPARWSLVLKSAIPILRSRNPAVEDTIRVETEVSLYRGLPGVYIENRVHKPEVLDAEALYFAYPFAAGTPPRADLVGGVMVPGRDQIPRSADDWHAIQRWVRFDDPGKEAVWVTLDVPLVQFGGLNTGRYGRGLSLERPLLYSWPMNNYWFTNFLASQRGDFVFRYVVAGGALAASDAAANRFGREACNALAAVGVEGRAEADVDSQASFVRIAPEELSLVGVKEAEGPRGGLVVRLRNYSDAARKARIEVGLGRAPRSAERTSIVEEPRGTLELSDSAVELEIGPWALETVLLRWSDSR